MDEDYGFSKKKSMHRNSPVSFTDETLADLDITMNVSGYLAILLKHLFV